MDQATGEVVRDPGTLQRIADLVIPPAWQDVWICPFPNGHLQAVGTDARGRRQYRYHDAWRQRRDVEKFDKMLEFARALPAARKRIAAALGSSDELTRERVLACAVRLLDHGFFRIGSEEYAEENETYGLATMRREHVTISGAAVVFDYVAKSGKQRIQSVTDPEVRAVVAALRRRRAPSPELLAYRDADRAWRDVTSRDINAEIKVLFGQEFTAKDFRTWNATVLAAVGLAVSGAATASTTARTRAVTRVVAEVAHYLGNTPAVCRASYIDPRVFDRFRAGHVVSLERLGEDVAFGQPLFQGAIEEAVLDLLDERYDADTVDDVDVIIELAEQAVA